MTDKQKRFVGLVVHKHYVMVGAVNTYQELVLPPRKVSLAEFEGWAKKHRRPMPGIYMTCSNPWSSG